MMDSIDLGDDDDGILVTATDSSDFLAPTERSRTAAPMNHIVEEPNFLSEEEEEHVVEFFKDEAVGSIRETTTRPKRKHHHNRTRSMPVISLPIKSVLPQPATPATTEPLSESKDDTHINSLRPYKLQRKRSSTIGLLAKHANTNKRLSDRDLDDGESEDFPVAIPSIAHGKEVDLSRRKRGKICVVYVAVTAFALLASLLGVLLGEKDQEKDQSKEGASSNNNNQTPGGPNEASSPAPSMAPTDIGGVLQHKSEFSHYIVQWGIQTKGCQKVEWPPLELSCGEGDSGAVVQVMDLIVSDGFGETGQNVECVRIHANKIQCQMHDFSPDDVDVDEHKYTGHPLFGVVLVTCGGDKDPTKPGSAIYSSLDLTAHIPLQSYATECNHLFSSNQVQENETFKRHGGFAMPYVSMGRVCRGASFDFGDRRNVRRRVANGVDFNDLFHIRTNGFCEQGTRTSKEFEFKGKERQQAFCQQSSKCTTLQVCSSAETCTGSSECDVPSGSILLDMVDFTTDYDHEPCYFDKMLSEEWMWTLMAREMGKSPTLDTSD